jgi:hypothetical protein
MWRTTFCAAVVGALLTTNSAFAVTIYGGTATGSPGPSQFALVTVNESTGILTAVGPASFNVGLDFTPEGRALYGLSNSLRRINPQTGVTTEIGPLSENGGPSIVMSDMTIAPNGDIYAITNDSNPSKLYQVDAASGALTFKGAFDDAILMRTLEFSPDGLLYGGFGNLYIIDPATAAIVQDLGRFGGTGENVIAIEDLDFGPDGVMRGSLIDRNSTPTLIDGELYRIRLDSAPGDRATLLTPIQTGVRLWSIATVPEPSTLFLGVLGLALAACACLRRAGR